MEFIDMYNPVFNELFSSLNSCNRWNFYNLNHQLFFVKKSINDWANKNKIDDIIKQEMLNSAETVFNQSFYIIHNDLHYIDINDPSEVDDIFKINKYHIMQMYLYDRIKQVQKKILDIIIKNYVIHCFF